MGNFHLCAHYFQALGSKVNSWNFTGWIIICITEQMENRVSTELPNQESVGVYDLQSR